MLKDLIEDLKLFIQMVGKIEMQDLVPVNYYKLGYQGKSISPSVSKDSAAYREYLAGFFCHENDGKLDLSRVAQQ